MLYNAGTVYRQYSSISSTTVLLINTGIIVSKIVEYISSKFVRGNQAKSIPGTW